jgi:small subunit ribosomal protein S8
MVTDPIADMITRLKNAGAAGNDIVTVPYSKMKMAIAELLVKEGFVKEVAKKGKKVAKSIELGLIYEDDAPRVKGAERVSKFSKRVYRKAKDLKPVKNGYGILVLTTPKGIISDKEAREQNIGGEALFKIW